MTIYDVNGVTPVAAWIPSLDSVGNGTTTLTDLIGSNDGTLTMMDAATDWVADTGSGGVRALDFDGSDDYVVMPSFAFPAPFSVSIWFKPTDTSGVEILFSRKSDATTAVNQSVQVFMNGSAITGRVYSGVNSFIGRTSTGVVTTSWNHLVMTYTGGTSASAVRLYIGGVRVDDADSVSGTFTAYQSGSIPFALGVQNHLTTPSAPFAGRQDDIRLFDVVLKSSGMSYLYNRNFGRGRLWDADGEINRYQAISRRLARRSWSANLGSNSAADLASVLTRKLNRESI